jgi:hypothetical protein
MPKACIVFKSLIYVLYYVEIDLIVQYYLLFSKICLN